MVCSREQYKNRQESPNIGSWSRVHVSGLKIEISLGWLVSYELTSELSQKYVLRKRSSAVRCNFWKWGKYGNETENKNQSWMIDFSNEFQLYYDSDLRRIEQNIGFEEKIEWLSVWFWKMFLQKGQTREWERNWSKLFSVVLKSYLFFSSLTYNE